MSNPLPVAGLDPQPPLSRSGNGRRRVRRSRSSELEGAREAAETANRVKEHFLRNVSHAIWTPMNGVLGLTALALETDLNGEQREYLTLIQESANALLTVVDDIIDFSGIQEHRFALDTVDFDLRDTVDDAICAFAMRAEEKGVVLVSQIEPGTPLLLRGDPARLRRVLGNLIGNAVKFTGRGEILVSVTPVSLSHDFGILCFSVCDTGIGIPEQRQQGIFEALLPGDGAGTGFNGTGLGLAISKHLVELMGGTIVLERTSGKGSTFTFTARVELVNSDAPRRSEAMPAVQDVPILIAVDSPTTRRSLRQRLNGWGMWPRAVDNAASALQELSRAARVGRPYRIVLLDGHAPQFDGFALASEIRRRQELADLRLLMVAAGRRGDVALCESVGISGYLSKPFSQADLFDAIRLLLGSGNPAGKPPFVTLHSLAAGRRRLRILLAEDDSVSSKFATRLLENRGHAVLAVADGRKALDALGKESFDLLLTDVQMADVDGLELARAVRAAEQTAGERLPIVAMTAHAMNGDRERILSAGIDGYVAKPIRAEKLFDAIDQASAGIPSTAREPDPLRAASEFERALLLEQIGGDRELLKEMIGLFGEDFPPLVARARSAIGGGDAAELERAAHALKSLVGNFYAEGALLTARRLELLATERELAAAPEVLAALESRLSALHEALLSVRMEATS